MLVKIDDEFVETLLKCMDSFIRHHDEYQSTKQEVLRAVEFSINLEKKRGIAVNNYNVEQEDDGVDPADKPVPPGHIQPLGQEPRKIKNANQD